MHTEQGLEEMQKIAEHMMRGQLAVQACDQIDEADIDNTSLQAFIDDWLATEEGQAETKQLADEMLGDGDIKVHSPWL